MTIMRDNYLSLVKKGYVLRLDENYELVLLPPSQQKGCLDYQYQRDVVIPASSGVDCFGNTNNNNDNTLFYCIEDSEDSDEFESDDDDDEDCEDVEVEKDDDNTDDTDDEDVNEEVKKDEQEKETRVQIVSNTDDNGEDNFTNSVRPMIKSWADEEWSGIAADDSGIPEWARTFGIKFNNVADYELNRAPESSLINRPDEDSVINLISIPESGEVYNVDELSKTVLNNTTDHEWNQHSKYPPQALTAMADRAPESSVINRPDEDSVINLISIPESGVVYKVDELSNREYNQHSKYPPQALTAMADRAPESSVINRPDEDSVINLISIPESGVVNSVDELTAADITLADVAEYFALHGLLNVPTTNADDAAMETYKSADTNWQSTTNELNGTIGYIKSPTDLSAANMSVHVPESTYKLINANEHYNEHVIPNHVTDIFNNTQSDTFSVFYVEEDKIAELIKGIEKDGKWIVECEPPSDLAKLPMVYNDIHNDSHIRSENDAAQSCVKVDDRTIEPYGEEPWTVAHGALPNLETIPIFDDKEIGCNEEHVDASTINLSNNVHLFDQMKDNINISDVTPWIYTLFDDWNEDPSVMMTTEVPDWTWMAALLKQQQIAIAADHTYSTASINMDDTAQDNDMCSEAEESQITNSNNVNDMYYEAEQSPITNSHKLNDTCYEAGQYNITNSNKLNDTCYKAEQYNITNSNKLNDTCYKAEQYNITNSNKVNDTCYEAEQSNVIDSNNANYTYYEDISSDEDSYSEAPVAAASLVTHPILLQCGQGDYYKSNEKNSYPHLWTQCFKNKNIFNWADEALHQSRPSVIKELKPTVLDPNFPIHIDNETLELSLEMDDSDKRPTNNVTQSSINRNVSNWAEEALYRTRPSVIKPTGLDPNFPIHIDNGNLKRSLEMDDSEERPTKKMKFGCDDQHSTKDRNLFNWAQETLGQSSHCVSSHAMTIPSLDYENKPDRKRKLETDQSTDLNDLTDKRRRLTSNDVPSENSNRKSIFAWAPGVMLY